MKTIIFLSLLIITSPVFCQDVMTKKNGEDIQVKVLEISQSEVKYKKFDNPDGPLISIPKSELLMIRYQNGSKDLFTETKQIASKTERPETGGLDSYSEGQDDATRYYKGSKGANAGTIATTILTSPVFGLIPAIACSSTSPDESNLNFPSRDKFQQTEYYRGYTQRAKKIKSRKVWTNFGIGSGIWLVLILLI